MVVSGQLSRTMVRKGSSDSKARITTRLCAGCGKPIQSGLYCAICLDKFRDRAKSQGKRIESMKSKSMEKVAVDRHDTLILIAISEDRNLNLTKILLERALPNYKILTANTNFNAINTLISREISLVVLDADFGGMDILRRIRDDDRFKNIPVMIMSSSTKRELVAEVFSLGVQDYVTKPCEPSTLIARVDKMVAANESASTSDSQQKNVFNILLIDDDIFDLRQERETLKNRFPCEINTAQSAMEGMKLLENHGADLILVSLDMPFVNGLKFLSLVLANNRFKNIPVIIMTATRDFAILSEVNKSAAAGCVRKPNLAEDGLALIEDKLLRRR